MPFADSVGLEAPMTNLRTLSNQALLSILLGSNVAGEYSSQSLSDIFGLCSSGRAAVCESEAAYVAQPIFGAAKELLIRALNEQMRSQDSMSSPEAVRNYLRLTIGGLGYEVFTVLFLDAQNRLIEACELFRGTLTQTSVYPREVVKMALQCNSAAVILAHNHPSGLTEPSRADESLTQALKQALALVDVKVLDHFIVSGTANPMSFAERGLL